MLNSVPLFVGLRYVRARSHKFFVSFITWVSLLCVCLGVAALIAILSVMNGLEGELRSRLLSLSAHARVFVAPEARSVQPPDWSALATTLRSTPGVVAAAPYLEIEALAMRKPDMLPVRLRGVDPAHESDVGKLSKSLVEGALSDLVPGEDRVLVSRTLALQLQVGLGDALTLLIPVTDAQGVPEPRLREFTVAGIFDTEVTEYDTLLFGVLDDLRALVPNADARTALHVNFTDAMQAPAMSQTLAATMPAGVEVRGWTLDHASYFRAVRIEKTMVAIILMLIVAVAAFYLVAMLAMVVTDKRTDIAILRTLGTSPRQIMKVFLIQGSVIAWFGVALGVALGTLLGHYAEPIVGFLERLFSFQVFDAEVFVYTRMPSEVHADQVIWTAVVAMVITLAATIYPAWRASRVPPADALRYE
jgi:lipoprotein-releasing system permease protein